MASNCSHRDIASSLVEAAIVRHGAENGLSDGFRLVLSRSLEQLHELDGHVEFYTRAVHEHARGDETVQRLQTVPGFGPVVASVFGHDCFAVTTLTLQEVLVNGAYIDKLTTFAAAPYRRITPSANPTYEGLSVSGRSD